MIGGYMHTTANIKSNVLKRGDRFEIDSSSAYKIIQIEYIDHDNDSVTYTDTGSSLTTNKQWNREYTSSIEEFLKKVSSMNYTPRRG